MILLSSPMMLTLRSLPLPSGLPATHAVPLHISDSPVSGSALTFVRSLSDAGAFCAAVIHALPFHLIMSLVFGLGAVTFAKSFNVEVPAEESTTIPPPVDPSPTYSFLVSVA